jgi:hypothetical protein
VQVTEFLRKLGEKRARRVGIFAALMRTRASRLAAEHVQALNMLDVEFYKEEKVIAAWKAYSNHLNIEVKDPKNLTAWGQRQDELFLDLLTAIAENLGYRLDRTDIRRSAYFPKGHGELETDQQRIRKGIIAVFEGERALPVEMRPGSAPAAR